jgi:hypothetical protein
VLEDLKKIVDGIRIVLGRIALLVLICQSSDQEISNWTVNLTIILWMRL